MIQENTRGVDKWNKEKAAKKKKKKVWEAVWMWPHWRSLGSGCLSSPLGVGGWELQSGGELIPWHFPPAPGQRETRGKQLKVLAVGNGNNQEHGKCQGHGVDSATVCFLPLTHPLVAHENFISCYFKFAAGHSGYWTGYRPHCCHWFQGYHW